MNNIWNPQLDQHSQVFVQRFGALNAAQLNWKPAPDQWSIAQNIQHLIIINESYYPVLESLHQNRYRVPFWGKIGFLTSWLGKAILSSVQPDRRRKMKTFTIWQPADSNLPADIVQQFVQHHEQLKKNIAAALPFVEKGAVIASPANRNIVYKLADAFDIITTHEQRHLQQASEILPLIPPVA